MRLGREPSASSRQSLAFSKTLTLTVAPTPLPNGPLSPLIFIPFFLLLLVVCQFLEIFTRQDILGQYSMVNLELFNIVEEVRKVSKAFVVHPKNVNAENATSMIWFTGCLSLLIPIMLNNITYFFGGLQFYRSCCPPSYCRRWKVMTTQRESSCFMAFRIYQYTCKLRN